MEEERRRRVWGGEGWKASWTGRDKKAENGRFSAGMAEMKVRNDVG